MKYLVVANQTLGGQRLLDKLRELAGPDTSVHLVVPATPTWSLGDLRPYAWMAPDGEPTGPKRAQQRLYEGLARLRQEGIKATGSIGHADPLQAIAAAVAASEYDEIIVSTLRRAVSHRLRMDVPSRAHRRFGLPVTRIEFQGTVRGVDGQSRRQALWVQRVMGQRRFPLRGSGLRPTS